MRRDTIPAARLAPETESLPPADTAQEMPEHRCSFVKDEDGTVLFFAVAMMIVMFMLGGMGVDIMRFETTRTELQQTLDRSTLAAASMTQELAADEVVIDYFTKAGLADKLTQVQVDEGLNFRTVRAEAKASTNPIFLRLYSQSVVSDIEARALSVAEQRVTNVEISLVLDVSGSMAGSKLTNLKTAAKEFVDTVLDSDGENRISMSIIPYNGQVNLPQNMQELFTNRVGDHNVDDVNCFDLPPSVYSGLGMPLSGAMPVTGHVDTYSGTSTSSGYVSATGSSALPNANNRWCPVSSTNRILPPTNSKTALKNHIDGLTAVGATSINAGMKWGMTLLDPGSRPIISAMVADGSTPGYFNGRPFEYGDREGMKVVILMTDGDHFAEERLNDGYRTEDSTIFRGSDGYYSRYQNRSGTTADYWVPHRSEWRTAPWPDASRATRLSWDQVWANLRVSWVAWQMYARPAGNSATAYYNAMDMFRTKTAISDMNDQLQGVCNRAREENVIVYGIAFEAPQNGAYQIEKCASTPSHFFDATGLEIQSAFRSIASNISQLRLTQ
jgi:Flp pilus assembly protein TadG